MSLGQEGEEIFGMKHLAIEGSDLMICILLGRTAGLSAIQKNGVSRSFVGKS